MPIVNDSSRKQKRRDYFPTHFMRPLLPWQQTSQGYYKKKKSPTNIPNEYRWKNPQLNIRKVNLVTYKKDNKS